MSVEQLFGAYQADQNFVAGIEKFAETNMRKGKMRSFSDLIKLRGNQGLREMARGLDERHVKILADNRRSKPFLPPEDFEYRRNMAAVLWGAIFETIEEMAVDQEYDPLTLYEGFESGLVGTPFRNTLTVNSKIIRELSAGDMEKLMAGIHTDKTFASFITNAGLHALPGDLASTIRNFECFSTLRDDFIPKYKERAVLLLPEAQISSIQIPNPTPMIPAVSIDF